MSLYSVVSLVFQLLLVLQVRLAASQGPPSYSCHVDRDCASVNPDATFNFVYCDHEDHSCLGCPPRTIDPGLCHFNNDGRGVPVKHSVAVVQDEPCGTTGGKTCQRRWDISNTTSTADGYVATFGQCGTVSACGTLKLPGGATCTMTFVSMSAQPGIGGGHIYLFSASGCSSNGNFQFTDAAYGCGYELQQLVGSAWHTIATLCFKEGSQTSRVVLV